MTDRPTSPRPLSAVRADLDALDADILALLSRRMDLVGEVAGYKRAHGVRIRDLERERTVLADRKARATVLGLPAGEIESIWRLLMLASRDRQAALRAELPLDDEPKTVAVIGGRGGMGQLLCRLFDDLGHRVLVADLGSALSADRAAASADVVVVSVPIAATEAVIDAVGPHVRADALLMDVTSIKAAPLAAMLRATEASGASVVGTHPMFGPGVHSFQGQRVVVCAGRGDAWLAWVRRVFSARGLVITDADPLQHDRAMALVQVLTHFQTQVLGLALARLGGPLEASLRFTSPAYLLELYVAARHFAQSPQLYGPIEMLNPSAADVTEAFERAASELGEIIRTRSQARFEAVFEEVRAFFGAFTDEALEQSGFLIDRLVELSAGR